MITIGCMANSHIRFDMPHEDTKVLFTDYKHIYKSFLQYFPSSTLTERGAISKMKRMAYEPICMGTLKAMVPNSSDVVTRSRFQLVSPG
jgi:hypothetical protein